MRRAFSVIRWIVGAVLALLGIFGFPKSWAASDKFFGLLHLVQADPISRGVATLIGFLVIAYCLAEVLVDWRLGRLASRPTANFTEWDKVNFFLPWQASWLWNGVEPVSSQIVNTLAHATFRRFEEAVVAGRFRTVEIPTWESAKIGRQIWMDFAIEVGERPAFLFAAERTLLRRICHRVRVREATKSEQATYFKVADIYFFKHHQNGSADYSAIQSEVQQSLRDGAALGIARKYLGDVLGPYERVPVRAWKALQLSYSSVDDLSGKKIYGEVKVFFPRSSS